MSHSSDIEFMISEGGISLPSIRLQHSKPLLNFYQEQGPLWSCYKTGDFGPAPEHGDLGLAPELETFILL